jgi:FlaA1/EpsC-like NDP-sugar epimerase
MVYLRNRHFFLIDLVLIPLTALTAFILRLNPDQLQSHLQHLLVFVAVLLPVRLGVFLLLGLYSRFWRYASVDELLLILTAVGLSTVVTAGLVLGVAPPLVGISGFPRSAPFIEGLLALLTVGGPRFALRLLHRRPRSAAGGVGELRERRVLVVGAGDAGARLVKETRTNPSLRLTPLGFVDDDKNKQGIRIHGVRVLGETKHLGRLIRELAADEVIIAMAGAPGDVIRELLGVCFREGVPARRVPDLHELLSSDVRVSQVREIEVGDLLRREQVEMDSAAVARMLGDRRILVTGAGGSIGSELCRQIAPCRPASLMLMGHGENSVFAIATELQRLWPRLPVPAVIADIRDAQRLRQVFDIHGPEIVFHAAAHKHVQLMEHNVQEAVANNVQGTAALLDLAAERDVERFVLVSTDKAVNPTNVMGASKRVAELLVQAAATGTGRPYVAVRFGNVLGSRGSVVPLFRQQIARGGPVTVSHPNVRRYFMTIPEAVRLVLQAATLDQGGAVMVLDMGEPVRIVDLAKDLVELSGLKVGQDIDIVYTGLKPGEKMSEELFVEGEEYVPTNHPKIYVAREGSFSAPDPAVLDKAVEELIALAGGADADRVRRKLQEIVPEYQPPPDHGGALSGSAAPPEVR